MNREQSVKRAAARAWPTMPYYEWLEFCEREGVERETRVFAGDGAEWFLTTHRWDGQPPPNAWVRVPLWALRLAWDRELKRGETGAP